MTDYADLTDDQRAQACADAFKPMADAAKELLSRDPVAGDRVFLNGSSEHYTYVTALPDGRHVITAIMRDDDGNEFDGETRVVHQVYRQSDIHVVVDKTLAEKRAELIAVNMELYELRADAKAARVEKESLLAELKSVDALRGVADFTAGRVTHYVILDWSSPRIITFEEAMPYKSYDRDHNTKLLSLFGRSGGDLSWHINEWSDGSGNWTRVIPCLSLEHAQEELRKEILRLCDEAMREHRPVRQSVVIEAEKAGIELPSDALVAYWQSVVKQREATREATRVAFQAADAALDDAKAALAKSGVHQ